MLCHLHVPLIVCALHGGVPEKQPIDFLPARRVLEEAIALRAFPGCAAAVGTHEGNLWCEGVGRLDYEGGPEVEPGTLYDLASLTKVVGTTTVAAVLADQGKLSIDRHVAELFDVLGDPAWQAVTVEHILTHSSGLPAWRPLYRELQGYEQVIAGVLATPLESPPGAVERYSDLGFLLLGETLARITRKPLPALERELVFGPLGMTETCRNPPASRREAIAPTEVRPQAAGEPPHPTRGVVHDENALAAGGASGHAGLFSSAIDVSRFAREMLLAWRGESRLLSKATARRFFARRELVKGSSRALGWDTPSGESSAGSLFGPRSFGHTGFTGTSIWIDPDRDLYVVLLSNRVYPTRDNSRILRVRRRLADTVVLCIERKIARL